MSADSSPSTLPEVPAILYDDDRLEKIRETGLLDGDTVENFDRLTRQAADAIGAPASFVSMVTEDGQFLRGCVGLPEPLSSTRKTSLEHSICKYTLDRTEPLVMESVADDPDLGGHPAVEEYGIEAYLGVPLLSAEGHAVGTFCVVDWKPRAWTEDDVGTAEDFAASAQTEIELRLELHRREKLEDQLRSRTDAFEALVENITDVVTVLDAEGTIQFESPSAKDVLGYEPQELEGTSIWNYVHPDDREVLQAKMEAALSDPDRRPTTEFRFRHADGTWRLLESSGRRLPEDTDLGTFIGVSRDVTERRRLEEQVRLLADAVERAETGVVITGPQLDPPGPKIQYVNPAMMEITGYSEAELLGNTPRMLQGPKTSREPLDRLKRRLSAGKSVTDEVVNYRKDGTPYYVRWRIAPIQNDDGETTHFVSVQQDVTAEKEREQELEHRVQERTQALREARDEAERSNRLKSALLANMHHEIRTPLTSIIGFAQSIGEEAAGADSGLPMVQRFAGLIEKSGRRLLDALTAVLNLAQLEAGEMKLSRETVDAADELEKAAEQFAVEAEKKDVSLTIESPDAPLWATADPDGLQLVLKSLIGNAVKFTGEGGTVTGRARTEEAMVVVEVEDTGIGMDPASVPDLFDAFQQASEGMGREYEGTGLGLTITKEAVDQMDGSLEVETEEGTGTRVTVRFPRAEESGCKQ